MHSTCDRHAVHQSWQPSQNILKPSSLSSTYIAQSWAAVWLTHYTPATATISRMRFSYTLLPTGMYTHVVLPSRHVKGNYAHKLLCSSGLIMLLRIVTCTLCSLFFFHEHAVALLLMKLALYSFSWLSFSINSVLLLFMNYTEQQFGKACPADMQVIKAVSTHFQIENTMVDVSGGHLTSQT